MATDYTPGGRVGKLIVRGRTLKRDVAEAVLDGEVSMTTDQVTQLTVTVEDADNALLASRLFDLGGQADYGDLLLEVAAVATADSSGVATLEIEARSLGAQRMRRAKGKLVERNTSPTAYMQRRAAAAGLRFLGQPSAKRKTIRRQTGDQAESDYDTGQRLAQELGFVAFEAGGRYYFGRPTWLLKHTDAITLSPDTTGVMSRPTCRRSSDNPKAVTVDLEVDDTLAGKLRPGGAIDLTGVPTFEGLYLIDSVTIPLDDSANVAVSCSTPDNPKPQPATATTAGAGASSSALVAAGRAEGGGTAARFVAYALEQAGDRYVFGAEVNLNDRNPDTFDCSELVQWAAARCGVNFVDGAANQLARCRAKGTVISVDRAIATRGALLFGGTRVGSSTYVTHVAISLGNGRTIEAVNRQYGVREMSATGRQTVTWVGAGKVPGLEYAGLVRRGNVRQDPLT